MSPTPGAGAQRREAVALGLPLAIPQHRACSLPMPWFPTSVPSSRATLKVTTSEKPSWQLKQAEFSSL